MTDNEIVKALICCCDDSDGVAKCAICPFNIDDYQNFCVDELLEQALTLINRQQAEIERLNGELIAEKTRRENAVNAYHEAKADAIKEFAERLKANIRTFPKLDFGGCFYYTIGERAIDNLAKEMAGDSDA